MHFLPALKHRLAGVPAGLAAALAIFALGYWGLHLMLYGAGGRIGPPTTEMATHSPNPEHSNGPRSATGIAAPTPHRPHYAPHSSRHAGSVNPHPHGTPTPNQATPHH